MDANVTKGAFGHLSFLSPFPLHYRERKERGAGTYDAFIG